MPANPMTLKAVDSVLQLDLNVSAAVRDQVRRVLSEVETESCLQTEAARILEIGPSTLYAWRTGKWPAAPHEFIFKTYQTAGGECRYFKKELYAYTRLRRLLSGRDNPQPVITREMLLREVAYGDGRMEV